MTATLPQQAAPFSANGHRPGPSAEIAGALQEELSKRLDGEVRFDAVSRMLYSTDASNYQIEPVGVVVPRTIDDVLASIEVATRFLDDQSVPEEGRYVFAYTVHIRNDGKVPARLLGRRWLITDGNGKEQEVVGEGVVGEQPWLRPGEGFEYTSGAVLETDIGTMRGSYDVLADDGTRFAAPIPPFTLSIPRTLH